MNSTLAFEDVADTAYVTAHYRASESEREDALFHDPFARTLAGPHGAAATAKMPLKEKHASGIIVRTCVMDEYILHCVHNLGVDAVVSFGAGLDTRPYRLDLPESLIWIETDFKAVIDYKTKQLAGNKPNCQLESVAMDVTNASERGALLNSLDERANRVLVMTEGLLIYLHIDEVAAMARDISSHQNVHLWITDLASPEGMQLIQQDIANNPVEKGTKLQFAPTEGVQFFKRFGAWESITYRSLIEEGMRLQRLEVPEDMEGLLATPGYGDKIRDLVGFHMLARES